ncbi:MAG: M20 family metallopeptidase [Lachnospiraceae bacterium]|nr:M20 family metallopeptidase [Lachnospiraceae bacterium]
MSKEALFQCIDEQGEALFDMASRIFDHPEGGGKEYAAAELLENALEAEGFQVERGIGGLETAFRATWSNGIGGPNIGILGEYDALADRGHACGHHLQTPAAIGAAVAMKKIFETTDFPGAESAGVPFTITVYGTPAEETFGGKITMAKNGCFSELDIALGTHACGKAAFVGARSMALRTFRVTFKGKSSHAAGAPYNGRSAADAMLLSFNGIEFMREHVKDGTRMHYTIAETFGPSNVVPAVARANYTLRSKDNAYLSELEERFRKIIQGACLMTETEAEILTSENTFAARKPNLALAEVAVENLRQLGVPIDRESVRDSGGSTDFGNVSVIVPSALVYLPYCAASGHSQEWVDAGKTESAKSCLMNSAKVMAGMMYDIVLNPELVKNAQEQFDTE